MTSERGLYSAEDRILRMVEGVLFKPIKRENVVLGFHGTMGMAGARGTLVLRFDVLPAQSIGRPMVLQLPLVRTTGSLFLHLDRTINNNKKIIADGVQVPRRHKGGPFFICSNHNHHHSLLTMKFCKNLQRVADLSNPEWSPYWTDYKKLKVCV